MIRAGAIALLFLLPAFAGTARAQQRDTGVVQAGGKDGAAGSPDSGRVVRLPAVEVTVTRRAEALQRVPQAVSVVNVRDIRTARATIGLDESLSLVPGVVVENRYNFSLGTRISIRGFGSRAAFGVRGLRVLVDGIPLTNADGQAKLNSIDLGSAGEIEVLRGPSSTLYGNAAGGVIDVKTEAPPLATLAGEARVVAGDYGAGSRLGGLAKWQLQAGGTSGRASYLGSFARTVTDGFREHSAARLSVFNGTTSYRLRPNTTLHALLNLADQPQGDNPGALPLDSARLRPEAAWPTNVRTDAAERSRQAEAGVRLEQALRRGRAEVTVYGLNRAVDNPIVTSIIDLNRHSGGIRSTVTADGRVGPFVAGIVTGFDLELQRDARREYANSSGVRGPETRDQIDRVSAVGPFAELRLDPVPGLRLTAGARYDAIDFATDDRFLGDGDNSGSRRMSALSPKLSLLYAASDALSVYGTAATSFQTPTTTELINAPPPAGETCCAGGFNQALRPERALSGEAGARGRLGTWLRYDFAAYTMSVRDEIVSYRVPQAPDRDFYRNSARSRHRGLEAALEAAPTSFLRLGLAYTYARFTFVDDGLSQQSYEGNRLPGIPSHQLTGRLSLAHAGLLAELEGQHVARFFVDDANTVSNPAYTVFDVRLSGGRGIGGLRVAPFVAVENVLDRRYNGSVVVNATGGRYFEPAPGRHLLLGLALPTTHWPY